MIMDEGWFCHWTSTKSAMNLNLEFNVNLTKISKEKRDGQFLRWLD